MSTSQPISETIILRVNDGVNLRKAGPNSNDPSAKKFHEILNLTKAQPGHISQFWGHMVENPNYVAVVYNWESAELQAQYLKSEAHDTILASLSEVFNIKEFSPFIMYHSFNPDAIAAYQSPVTEVAFFTLPTASYEKSKKIIEGGLNGASGPNVMELVVSVGKATGAATGWVDSSKPSSALPESRSVALYGVFGYASIDTHMKWRETPEHAEVVKYQTKQFEGLDLQAAVVKDVDLSMFHVHFEEGS